MKPIYKPQEKPYTQDINDLIEDGMQKGWNSTSPREGFAYQANKDKKIQGIGGGKYAAYEKDKKVNQTFSNADQAKEYLASKEHEEPSEE